MVNKFKFGLEIFLSLVFSVGLNNLIRTFDYVETLSQYPTVVFNLFTAFFSFISLNFIIAALLFSIRITEDTRKDFYWIGFLYVASGFSVLLGLVSLGFTCNPVPHIASFPCFDILSFEGQIIGIFADLMNIIGMSGFFLASFEFLFQILKLTRQKP